MGPAEPEEVFPLFRFESDDEARSEVGLASERVAAAERAATSRDSVSSIAENILGDIAWRREGSCEDDGSDGIHLHFRQKNAPVSPRPASIPNEDELLNRFTERVEDEKELHEVSRDFEYRTRRTTLVLRSAQSGAEHLGRSPAADSTQSTPSCRKDSVRAISDTSRWGRCVQDERGRG